MDFYEKGAMDTFDVLDEHKILYCGAGRNMEDAKKLRIIRIFYNLLNIALFLV